MASINDVFSQYEPDQPIIKLNLPKSKSEFLARLVEANIPGARFLKEFHDNPEGPVTSSIDKEAQAMVPFYNSVIRPVIKGESPDFNSAFDEFLIAGSQPGGTAKALGAVPFILKKQGKNALVKPTNAGELATFKEAIKIGVRKGIIDPEDAKKMYLNAVTDLMVEANNVVNPNFNPNVVGQEYGAKLLDKSVIADWEGPKYDYARQVGANAGNAMKIYPQGEIPVGREKAPLYLQGKQGPLYYVENATDANQIRHNLTNYESLSPYMNKKLAEKYPSKYNPQRAEKIMTDYGPENMYNAIAKPQMINQAIVNESKKGRHAAMGADYTKNATKTYNEGRKALKEHPKYMSVEELLKLMTEIEP